MNILSKNILANDNKNTITLFINAVENTSSHNINNKQATSILIKICNKIKNKSTVIKPYTEYIQTYNNLKLLNNNLTSQGVTIKLARYIKAHYILYSLIYDNFDNTNLKIQLISVQNGEIICSQIIPI